MTEKIDANTINVIQQVLRTLTIALAGSAKADLHALAELLQSGSANAQLAPEAVLMLEDLAMGVGKIAGHMQPEGPDSAG
jgi:hypothetical protein